MELTLQWTESTDEHVRSYVNGIPTGSGGTHENGCRGAVNKAVRNYIDTHSLTPRGVKLTLEDIREGLIVILSVFIEDPQFQGQTKDRLNNPDVQSVVEAAIRPAMEQWMNNNRSVADSIVARIIAAARARAASRAAAAGGGGGRPQGAGNNILQFYTDDSPGLQVGPTTVLVASLSFVGIVVLLHIWGKFRM